MYAIALGATTGFFGRQALVLFYALARGQSIEVANEPTGYAAGTTRKGS